ncbi:MAG: hypothetical protein HY331_06255 [Chloroflexi bacterium]|nr:hypothetical protein [Chloroflexota bacterium]
MLQDGGRHYVYGLGLLAAISDADGSPTYYLQDGLGSVTGLTDLMGGSGAGAALHGDRRRLRPDGAGRVHARFLGAVTNHRPFW